MAENIFFSVIIPTYNRADLIGKTIESLLNQTFQNFELLIIDDGSSDNTEEVIKRIKDERISYFKKQNEERAAARNFGTKKAKGLYVNFFDSDDIAYPNHLETAYNFIQNKGEINIFHVNYDIKNLNGIIIRNTTPIYNVNEQLIDGNLIAVDGVFLKR